MRRLPIAALLAGALGAPLVAQAPPAFDVVSIRPNTSGDPRSGTRNLPGGRVTITNQPLRSMIRTAYGANDLDVVGGPGWPRRRPLHRQRRETSTGMNHSSSPAYRWVARYSRVPSALMA